MGFGSKGFRIACNAGGFGGFYLSIFRVSLASILDSLQTGRIGARMTECRKGGGREGEMKPEHPMGISTRPAKIRLYYHAKNRASTVKEGHFSPGQNPENPFLGLSLLSIPTEMLARQAYVSLDLFFLKL